MAVEAVVFDGGETRAAELAGVTPFTLMGVLRLVREQGRAEAELPAVLL